MMRSLWTGASGMNAQQLNIDTISNNIANVNTTGYKSERMEFQSMLYQTMRKADVTADGSRVRPVNLQVGHGARPVGTTRDLSTGSFERTEKEYNFAITGDAYFAVQTGLNQDGSPAIAYTRNGSFTFSPLENGNLLLVTQQGYPVLGQQGRTIEVPAGTELVVNAEGRMVFQSGENAIDANQSIGMFDFVNPQGLLSIGNGAYVPTVASGQATDDTSSSVVQGVLEMSNVNIADEMVRMIVTQRAYELNSKSITTSDSMLQTANELKR